jgi:catechol 2,3-dioxygenase-like lactoylglutathione lyase family enzyme
MLDIETLHHVALPVTDLDRSKRFYAEVLGLREIDRPPFDFPGCWFQLGDRQLHLIQRSDGTSRGAGSIDSRDIHFAIRVRNFHEALEALRSKGYREDRKNHDLLKMKINPAATAGFPQIFILDPDRHVIEVNAESMES